MAFEMLPVWLWWIAIAVALVLADISLLGSQFILVASAVAALLAALGAWLGLSLAGQLWLFLFGVVVLTPMLVIALRTRRCRRRVALLERGWEHGERIITRDRGDRIVARLKGDDYPVELDNGDQPDAGEMLIVQRMEGITLIAYREDR